jgi:hypothetical protein
VKRDAVAQLDFQRFVVCRPLMGGGQLRHDVQLFIQVEKLIAEAGKHDAADERARHRGVEDVGIFRQADSQGLRIDKGGEQGKPQSQNPFHDEPPD